VKLTISQHQTNIVLPGMKKKNLEKALLFVFIEQKVVGR
jgi:hypothetical protein